MKDDIQEVLITLFYLEILLLVGRYLVYFLKIPNPIPATLFVIAYSDKGRPLRQIITACQKNFDSKLGMLDWIKGYTQY